MTDYSNALAYLYGLERFGIVFGVENIQWILSTIGNPHERLRTIHIGGTNGKGSVAAMLSHIMKGAGYRVGKYTSPHLVSFTERITINETAITEGEVAELVESIRHRLERANPGERFTFFDFTTALALEYFRRSHVDIALIEVGLGGRLDSTNVVNPLVSIITNVAMDHMDYLGDDILRIAREKSGIIKKGVPVITGALDLPKRIIEETAHIQGSPVYSMGRDFSFTKAGTQRMSYTGLKLALSDIFVNLPGDHQLGNAALALCAMEILSSFGLKVDKGELRDGLTQVTWPGRLEVVSERPAVIIDGAHNRAGVEALTAFLRSLPKKGKRLLIFGVMKDKEYEGMLKELLPYFDEVILTMPANERALSPEIMKNIVPTAVIIHDSTKAVKEAQRIATPNDTIVITGSLYLVGEFKAIVHDIL